MYIEFFLELQNEIGVTPIIKAQFREVITERFQTAPENLTLPTLDLFKRLKTKGFVFCTTWKGMKVQLFHVKAPEKLNAGECFFQIGLSTPGTLSLKFAKYDETKSSTYLQPSEIPEEDEHSLVHDDNFFAELRKKSTTGTNLFNLLVAIDLNTGSYIRVPLSELFPQKYEKRGEQRPPLSNTRDSQHRATLDQTRYDTQGTQSDLKISIKISSSNKPKSFDQSDQQPKKRLTRSSSHNPEQARRQPVQHTECVAPIQDSDDNCMQKSEHLHGPTVCTDFNIKSDQAVLNEKLQDVYLPDEQANARLQDVYLPDEQANPSYPPIKKAVDDEARSLTKSHGPISLSKLNDIGDYNTNSKYRPLASEISAKPPVPNDGQIIGDGIITTNTISNPKYPNTETAVRDKISAQPSQINSANFTISTIPKCQPTGESAEANPSTINSLAEGPERALFNGLPCQREGPERTLFNGLPCQRDDEQTKPKIVEH